MSDETKINAQVVGVVHSIHVSRRGTEINVIPEQGMPDESPFYSCRLDHSASHLAAMLELAKTAMLNGLKISLFGFGDDRDDTLEFDEIRVVSKDCS